MNNKSLEERFWSHVDKNGPIYESLGTSCWIWTASKRPNGYGQFRVGTEIELAHRVSFKLFHEDMDDNLHVCHACDNPSCVNPTHLWQGTDFDNMRDAAIKGRVRHGETHYLYRHPEKHSHAKLSWNQVTEIRQKFSSGKFLQTEIAKMYGVTKNHIGYIVHNKEWVKAE